MKVFTFWHDFLEIIAALLVIGGAVAGVIRARGPQWRPFLRSLLPTLLLLAGAGTYAYLHFTSVPPPTLPPMTVALGEIVVPGTGVRISNVQSDSWLPVYSEAEHVKVVLHGKIEGPKMDGRRPFHAYALVCPGRGQGKWFVQKNEGELKTSPGPFEVEAYLGGTGPDSARDGDRFAVAVLLADFEVQDTYTDFGAIPGDRPMSPIYKLEVRRTPSQQMVGGDTGTRAEDGASPSAPQP